MINDKHLYCVGLYEELMCTTQNGVVLLIVTKKKILVIPLVCGWETRSITLLLRQRYCWVAERCNISAFFFYMLYILQIVQLEVEWNELNQSSARDTFIRILKAKMQLVAQLQAYFICCVDLTVNWHLL